MPQHRDDEHVTKVMYPRAWQSEHLVRTQQSEQVIHAWL